MLSSYRLRSAPPCAVFCRLATFKSENVCNLVAITLPRRVDFPNISLPQCAARATQLLNRAACFSSPSEEVPEEPHLSLHITSYLPVFVPCSNLRSFTVSASGDVSNVSLRSALGIPQMLRFRRHTFFAPCLFTRTTVTLAIPDVTLQRYIGHVLIINSDHETSGARTIMLADHPHSARAQVAKTLVVRSRMALPRGKDAQDLRLASHRHIKRVSSPGAHLGGAEQKVDLLEMWAKMNIDALIVLSSQRIAEGAAEHWHRCSSATG